MKHDLSQSERCVLMAIASHINGKTGQWRIGIHKIAEEAGVNQSYCRRVIASLRRKGVVASHVAGDDKACTWWIPMISTVEPCAESAHPPARNSRTGKGDERAGTSDKNAQDPSAKSAHNTLDSSPELNDLGELDGETDRLTAIELQLIAAKIDNGVSKAEAVREILAYRARRAGSREHGTSSGRAPKTRPLQSVGKILEEAEGVVS